MSSHFQAALWVLIYLLLAAFPVLVLLAGPVPPGGGRWWDFSMALGFAGLAIMGLQFVMTARFRRVTAPFGIDIIYYFHRWIALGGLALIIGHYAILRLRYGAALGSLNPLVAPGGMTAGRVALWLFILLAATSIWRRQLGIDYDGWRIGHALMAAAGVVLAVTHIESVGYYTNSESKRLVWTTYSVLWVLVLGYIRILKPWNLRRRPYKVVDVRRERGSAWTLKLAPAAGAPLKFSPGQFAWLTLRASPFAAREHPFSFSGSADAAGSLEFTIRELGDFTRTIGQTRVGETAYVDGPHGVFTTDRYPEAPGFGFIAGGVGIAPIMSMLRTLADRGDRRPLHLIYGNDRWENILFREEIETLRSRLNLHVVHVLEAPPADWTGETGLVTAAVEKAVPASLRDRVFFLCGPATMSEAVQRTLRTRGVPLRRIHFELFDMV